MTLAPTTLAPTTLATRTLATTTQPVGHLLRDWRQRRRLSQLHLALEAGVSSRHLSFVETGRALPSREMVMRLAEQLAVPLRERNTLLLAAGYAPAFAERPLQDPAMRAARQAVELLLAAHEPYPALAVDRHWHLQAANRAVTPLLAGIDEELLRPPLNVLRLSLHPQGLAPRIVNLSQWRDHLLVRLQRQVEASGDAELAALLRELRDYRPANGDDASAPASPPAEPLVVVPLRLRTPLGELAFLSTTTIFGTPVDVTLSELALETLLPADAATAAALRQLTPPAAADASSSTPPARR